jgi:DNA (cytosine-5)-methyltransferase 1
MLAQANEMDAANGVISDARKAAEGALRFKAASLFTGIGGFDIGLERAGFEITFQCEINKFCRSILKRHWPQIPHHENIKSLRATDIPQSDIWTGGFPCQDVSLARMGAREGLRGKRSGLFHDFARLIGEARPRVVLLENVAGLLSSHLGRDFGIVIGTLAEFGYSVGWRVFNSKNFGVPQSRQRVYIVGCHRDVHGPGQILFESEGGERDAEEGESNGQAALSPFKKSLGDIGGTGPVFQSIAYCLYACSARHTGTDWSRTYVQYPKRGQVRRLTPKECEGVMGFPLGWTLPHSGKFREDDLDSLRYHALGNAVTPPVAEWLAHRVHDYLTAKQDASAQHCI